MPTPIREDTDLAPQAIYWVGNIAFIQQDYATAARNLRRSDQEISQVNARARRYAEAGPVASWRMGQKSEGCTTLGLIKTKYPDAAVANAQPGRQPRAKTACSKMSA